MLATLSDMSHGFAGFESSVPDSYDQRHGRMLIRFATADSHEALTGQAGLPYPARTRPSAR
jgi:hypothetical protein